MIGLTHLQAECLAAIRRLTVNGVAPSYDELRQELGLRSCGHLLKVVHSLADRGAITFSPHRARSIRIVGDRDQAIDALRGLRAEDLRQVIAHAAGLAAAADGDGGGQTAHALRNIADRLTGQPRRHAA